MKIFYDCEFLENGRTIDLISIGMVREDGEELYCVNRTMPWPSIMRHPWLRENVVPHLPAIQRGGEGGALQLDLRHRDVYPRRAIAELVHSMLITGGGKPELWADYGAYDHVCLAQLFGTMMELPRDVPMFTRDIQQEIARLGDPEIPAQAPGEHHALADARHVRDVSEFLVGYEQAMIAEFAAEILTGH